jgi:hypothetical protein
MDGLYKSANDRRDGLAVRLEDAKADRRTDGILVTRGIPTAVQIEAHRGCFFLKGQTSPGLAEHDERNIPVDARATAAFQSGEGLKMIRGSS